MFIAALFSIAEIWKHLKCSSVDEWIKTAVIHLHNGIVLSCKKEGKRSFATAWIDLESIVLSEISQPEKDKYHMISLNM